MATINKIHKTLLDCKIHDDDAQWIAARLWMAIAEDVKQMVRSESDCAACPWRHVVMQKIKREDLI